MFAGQLSTKPTPNSVFFVYGSGIPEVDCSGEVIFEYHICENLFYHKIRSEENRTIVHKRADTVKEGRNYYKLIIDTIKS